MNARAPTAPLVSVLLASRDGARYLPEALRGLEAQTYRPIEIVAVDDGSTDATGSLLGSFARTHDGVRLLRTEGIGPAGARDHAFRESSGELIAIHDDDDVSRPDRIERQVAAFARNQALGVLGCGADIIDDEGAKIGIFPVPTDPVSVRRLLRRAPPFVNGSVMMRRSAYETAGGFRSAFSIAEDYDLWLRVPSEYEMANLATTLYAWRSHRASATAKDRTRMIFFAAVARTFAEERRASGRDSVALLAAHPNPEEFLAAYPMAGRLALHLGEALVREGRAREARRYLGRAIREGAGLGRAASWWALTWLLPVLGRGAGRP